MKIKHILVEKKYEAEDLYKKIKEGHSFEDLAQKFSICASAKEQGNLGDLSKKKHLLDLEFLEACEFLLVDSVSLPIRTKFGYHLIKKYE